MNNAKYFLLWNYRDSIELFNRICSYRNVGCVDVIISLKNAMSIDYISKPCNLVKSNLFNIAECYRRDIILKLINISVIYLWSGLDIRDTSFNQ